MHEGPPLHKKDGRTVISCTPCGFIHIMPLPTELEQTAFYENEFYAVERPKYFSDTEEDIEWWMATYRNYYHLFEKQVSGRRILDVGSGPGYFLLAGKERGWDALGVEPSPDAHAYSTEKGVSVLKDFFSYDVVKEHGTFDVIHAAMVLEHVPNPLEMLEDMKKLLNPGGLLAIFSPNDYNPLQDVLAKISFPPYWVVPDHHVNYFTITSLQRVVERMGMQVIDTVATFPLEFFLLSGNDYIREPSLGRGVHHARTKFEETMYAYNPELLNALYRSFAASRVGREFLLIAKS